MHSEQKNCVVYVHRLSPWIVKLGCDTHAYYARVSKKYIVWFTCIVKSVHSKQIKCVVYVHRLSPCIVKLGCNG